MPKPVRYKKLIRALRRQDSRFQVLPRRGKGSHRMIVHPDVNGKAESYPLKVHGKNPEIDGCYVRDLKKRFNLPENIFD